MRISTILLVTLAMAAATLCAPSPADAAASPFITFLSNKACAGNPSGFKAGCDGYLIFRMNQCNSPSDALSKCLTRCDRYDDQGKPGKANKCREGCHFLNGKE